MKIYVTPFSPDEENSGVDVTIEQSQIELIMLATKYVTLGSPSGQGPRGLHKWLMKLTKFLVDIADSYEAAGFPLGESDAAAIFWAIWYPDRIKWTNTGEFCVDIDLGFGV